MNKWFISQLKNRTLLKVWGTDSFKFLQSLSTNDINKILTEHEFALHKKFPDQLFSNNFDRSIYSIDYSNKQSKKYKKLITGLPSLFLSSNGKIIADCFIYNIKYIDDTKLFTLFYIDCNIQNLKRIIEILQKRKLSCDVYFKELKDINIYQFLPCISLLNNKCNYSNSNKSNVYEHFLNTFKNAFFFSKDERSSLLGYRVYEINDKSRNTLFANVDNNNNFEKVSTTGRNENDMEEAKNKKISNQINHILSKFVKNEKLKITNTIIYEYFKLCLGIIENLYSNYAFFKHNNVLDDINYDDALNDTITIGQSIKKDNQTKQKRANFLFKDLSPFDLNYDKFNYLAKNKGCYVGQEAINRTRNEILINKYELSFCVNYKYFETFVNNTNSLSKVILDDSIYDKYLKEEINDQNFLKFYFFLLKNVMESQKNMIIFQNQYGVFIQNNNVTSDSTVNGAIGHVFFYNHVMGLCFLIKKKIRDIKKDIFSPSSNIYIKNKDTEEKHKICFISFKFDSM